MDGTVKHPATLLVVDDEPGIREVMALALFAGGYHCIAATDGVEALAEVMNHPEIQGVITDLHMPNLDGFELARKLKDLRPDLPIVVCSGCISDDLRRALHEVGIPILPKPYTASQLLRCVDSMAHVSCAAAAA